MFEKDETFVATAGLVKSRVLPFSLIVFSTLFQVIEAFLFWRAGPS